MDPINLLGNFCPQDDAPATLAVCSALLKITVAASVVFTFFVYSPWLLVATAASISLDILILQNPDYFQKADEWVQEIIAQFQALPAPQPVQNPAIDWSQVKTFQGTVIIDSSLPSHYVASDARELYQHIKLENGSPLLQTDGAFYCAARLVFNENLDKIDAALKDVFLPDSLPSDLLEGLQPGDRLKFLWKEKILFDLAFEKSALGAFQKLKGKVHGYLVDEDVPEDHHLWGRLDAMRIFLSPTAEQIVPGVMGTQPCDFLTLPSFPADTDFLQLLNKGLNENVLMLQLAIPGCSEATIKEDVCILLDNNWLYVYFHRPKPLNEEPIKVIINTIPDHRLLSLDLNFFLSVKGEMLVKDKIRLGPVERGLATLFLPLHSAAASA